MRGCRAAAVLVGEGRRAEADAELRRSLAFWRSVGADAYVRRGEALLAAAGQLRSRRAKWNEPIASPALK